MDGRGGRGYNYRMGQRAISRVRTVSSNSEWDIYVVRSTPAKKWLGTVEATDVDAAIAEAVWRFDIKEPNKLNGERRRYRKPHSYPASPRTRVVAPQHALPPFRSSRALTGGHRGLPAQSKSSHAPQSR